VCQWHDLKLVKRCERTRIRPAPKKTSNIFLDTHHRRPGIIDQWPPRLARTSTARLFFWMPPQLELSRVALAGHGNQAGDLVVHSSGISHIQNIRPGRDYKQRQPGRNAELLRKHCALAIAGSTPNSRETLLSIRGHSHSEIYQSAFPSAWADGLRTTRPRDHPEKKTKTKFIL